MIRKEEGVERGAALTIDVDGHTVPSWEGETLATALLAAGMIIFRIDSRGNPRGLFCNMGTCCECLVDVVDSAGQYRTVRACLVDVVPDMSIRTMSGA
ncbi:(2Fe-2S)-binding protein [Sphingosinicella microcystinivorans]|uniref:(2Fe-2S)-binding protein n=1 Tax=Sphingosinicella microcystinivorans TaxID=335406 RepID=UPI0022F380A6|nr:(2Fe-2S)-binding protein [Sphingosinicella microcystinivorans]WBX84156.1 (2Fe-2S)-binding protein [Sphingosinicella microcystinivorans]